MTEEDLQALVIEMLHFRPHTRADHIARYIGAKSGHSISIATVNAVLKRLRTLGYVNIERAYSRRTDVPLRVVALTLPV